ncbi:MAG: hypothetical protein KJP21_02350, partial [Bacteroidia bacterium]|nr:hypothetical protein [Bacteroidia bacterium]
VQTWIYAISTDHTEKKTFYYLCNEDRTIRWVWPSENKKPLFLRFYTTASMKSKMFAVCVRILFLVRLQHLFVKKATANFDFFPVEYNIDSTQEWALFTGTKGPNRKLILTASNFSDKTTFTKIAYGVKTRQMLKNETRTIEKLTDFNFSYSILPQLLSSTKNHIQISDVSTGERSLRLETSHINALIEIAHKTKNNTVLGTTKMYLEAMESYKNLNMKNDQRLPKALKRKLQWLINSFDEHLKIETTIAHGDFTPWNCYVSNDQISLYDLEMAQDKMPLGYDAFHFVIQNGILVNQDSWKTIVKEIMAVICPAFFEGDKEKTLKYLKLYLLINTAYYLNIYSNQDEWHVQVNWLLQTWNEGISFVLQETIESRKLVLMDTFDFMQNRKYAALKFKGYIPEQISYLSDVDLCTTKKDAKALTKFLKNHSLVHEARIKNLSFMKNIELVLKNSELLSIDCIWQLRRKNIIIQDIDQVIKSACSNVFGVKQPSSLIEANYVNYFYALNKAQTPIQYRSKSFELEMEKLAKSTNPVAIQKSLQGMLKKKKVNKGLSLIKNSIYYVSDTIKNVLGQHGFIITFSGVDGAGKSTLIEITKQRIDKQLRKSVVVLRHRPSLLPILSAWTMGKDAAEQKAASTLPRQGENKSRISSFLRFGYYYIDYVVGQFYIYIKYVLRGKVVLYDRYYFDFISDSRRSNINLPSWITTMGYNLIMKPHLNIFLYADAETILARKQELNAETITTLTNKYLMLFKKLNKKSKTDAYIPINNVNLDTTINTIMDKLKKKAA